MSLNILTCRLGVVTATALSAAAAVMPATASGAGSSVPRAVCGAGSQPEPALQGQVPHQDRRNGRSQRGYTCNLKRLGQFQGHGSTWVSPSYGSCSYLSPSFVGPGLLTSGVKGVEVLDVRDVKRPRAVRRLRTPAMVSETWESLKVNATRGLLAGTSTGIGAGSGLFFDVYDVKTNCRKPRLLNGLGRTRLTLPANVLGHEGEWSPDGRTYWASGLIGGSLTAIDVVDPSHPRIVYTGAAGLPINHGLSVSQDGNRLYLATGFPAGFVTLDVSDVQRRERFPEVRTVATSSWNPLGISQHSIPVTYKGVPHLITADEFASEGVRIFDLADERRPREVRHLQLEIQQDSAKDVRRVDTTGNGGFGYDTHYCAVDRAVNPGALACSYFQSGVRVFDIRHPSRPREIAYFNPPAQVGRAEDLGGSAHANHFFGNLPPVSDVANGVLGTIFGERAAPNLTADWCSSPPRFVGRSQLWVTCQDNGFVTLKFTNRVYPVR